MLDDTTIVLNGDVNLRLWRATLVEYYTLMDRAERLDQQGQRDQAESLRLEAGNLLRSFPISSK